MCSDSSLCRSLGASRESIPLHFRVSPYISMKDLSLHIHTCILPPYIEILLRSLQEASMCLLLCDKMVCMGKEREACTACRWVYVSRVRVCWHESCKYTSYNHPGDPSVPASPAKRYIQQREYSNPRPRDLSFSPSLFFSFAAFLIHLLLLLLCHSGSCSHSGKH